MDGRTGIKALLCLFLVCGFVSTDDTVADDGTRSETRTDAGETTGKITSFEIYKKLFAKQRAMHLNVVKSLVTYQEYEYKYALLDKMFTKMMEIMGQAKLNLTEWGYIPGEHFTHNDTLKESVSKVLENTALFGELALRLPDITHALYDKNRDWHILMGWAVMFATESRVFDGPGGELLSLMSQEIGLIPKSDDYVNPYREEEVKKTLNEATAAKEKKKKGKSDKKKKEKKKGPRLSGMGHTEL